MRTNRIAPVTFDRPDSMDIANGFAAECEFGKNRKPNHKRSVRVAADDRPSQVLG